MTINDLAYNEESSQYFDQPPMPDYTYEIIPTFSLQDDTYLEGEEQENEVNGHIFDALKESLEEIDIKGRELFKNFFSKGDVEIPLGRLAREAIGDSRAKEFLRNISAKVVDKMKVDKDEDFVVADRGAGIDEELNEKLERFKVKTLTIGGPVGKDDKK